MKKIALYYHGGSKNHGCESIVRSIHKLLKDLDLTLFSFRKEDDLEFGLDKLMLVEQLGVNRSVKSLFFYLIKEKIKRRLPRLLLRFYSKLKSSPVNEYDILNQYNSLFVYPMQNLYLSIGGDNYCYPSGKKSLGYINSLLNNQLLLI